MEMILSFGFCILPLFFFAGFYKRCIKGVKEMNWQKEKLQRRDCTYNKVKLWIDENGSCHYKVQQTQCHDTIIPPPPRPFRLFLTITESLNDNDNIHLNEYKKANIDTVNQVVISLPFIYKCGPLNPPRSTPLPVDTIQNIAWGLSVL